MTTNVDDTGASNPTALETPRAADTNLSAAAKRKLEESKNRRPSASSLRFSRELLTVFSLLPYKKGHSPAPTVTMTGDEASCAGPTPYDEDNEPQSPLSLVGVGEEACSARSRRSLSQAASSSSAPAPIRLSISTRLQVDKATNLVCVPSPVDSASQIANRVIEALREANVPMMDGGRARPIHIDIDASTHVKGRGNVVAGDEVGREALRRRENVVLASLESKGPDAEKRRRRRRRRAEADDDNDEEDEEGGRPRANGNGTHESESEKYLDAEMGDAPEGEQGRQRSLKRTKSELNG